MGLVSGFSRWVGFVVWWCACWNGWCGVLVFGICVWLFGDVGWVCLFVAVGGLAICEAKEHRVTLFANGAD